MFFSFSCFSAEPLNRVLLDRPFVFFFREWQGGGLTEGGLVADDEAGAIREYPRCLPRLNPQCTVPTVAGGACGCGKWLIVRKSEAFQHQEC